MAEKDALGFNRRQERGILEWGAKCPQCGRKMIISSLREKDNIPLCKRCTDWKPSRKR